MPAPSVAQSMLPTASISIEAGDVIVPVPVIAPPDVNFTSRPAFTEPPEIVPVSDVTSTSLVEPVVVSCVKVTPCAPRSVVVSTLVALPTVTPAPVECRSRVVPAFRVAQLIRPAASISIRPVARAVPVPVIVVAAVSRAKPPPLIAPPWIAAFVEVTSTLTAPVVVSCVNTTSCAPTNCNRPLLVALPTVSVPPVVSARKPVAPAATSSRVKPLTPSTFTVPATADKQRRAHARQSLQIDVCC